MVPRETDSKASPGGSLTCVYCPSYSQGPHLRPSTYQVLIPYAYRGLFTAGPETALSLLSKVSHPKIFMFLGLWAGSDEVSAVKRESWTTVGNSRETRGPEDKVNGSGSERDRLGPCRKGGENPSEGC